MTFSYEHLVYLTKEAIFLIILASLPAIAASLIIGVLVAIFSATTQIQEQTLSFAPKMVGIYLSIIAFAASIGSMIIRFSITCFSQFLSNP